MERWGMIILTADDLVVARIAEPTVTPLATGPGLRLSGRGTCVNPGKIDHALAIYDHGLVARVALAPAPIEPMLGQDVDIDVDIALPVRPLDAALIPNHVRGRAR